MIAGDAELLFTEHWSRLLTSTAVGCSARSYKWDFPGPGPECNPAAAVLRVQAQEPWKNAVFVALQPDPSTFQVTRPVTCLMQIKVNVYTALNRSKRTLLIEKTRTEPPLWSEFKFASFPV